MPRFGYGFRPIRRGRHAGPVIPIVPIILSVASVAPYPADGEVIGVVSGGSGPYVLTDSAAGRFRLVGNQLCATGAAMGLGPHSVGITDFIQTRSFEIAVNISSAFPALAGAAPVRAWTPTGGAGTTLPAAFGANGNAALVGAPSYVDRGPHGQRLLNLSQASGQHATFSQVTITGDCELWAVVAVKSLAGTKNILGRAGSAASAIMVQNGAAALNVRTQGGTATSCPGPYTLNLGLQIVRLRYVQATGTATPYFNGDIGTATAVGSQGFVFDQIGRSNAGSLMDGYLGPIMLFDRLLSAQEAGDLLAYLQPWRSRVLYVASDGSDASGTPWSQATPYASLSQAIAFGLRPGGTIAPKRGQQHRSAPFALPASTTLDGGLWGNGAKAELLGSTAPALALVSGTTYSFALAVKPVGYVFRLGAGRVLAERLTEDAASPTAPAAGRWGWSAGTCYVNAGIALATGDIEASVDTTTDFMTIAQADCRARDLTLRFACASAASVSGTNFWCHSITAEACQGDGLDNSGSATGLWEECVATRNGRTPASGSDGDGFSCHGTSNVTRLRCRAYDNDRTQMRDLVTTSVIVDQCYMRGRQPLAVVPQAGTPSTQGTIARNSVLIADLASDTPYGVYNNNAGKMLLQFCTIYGKGAPGAGANAVYADTSGGTIAVTNCATFNFDRSLVAAGGAAISEDHNVLGSVRSGVAAGSGSVVANPLLTDPANDDLTLQAGSPCIGAGVAIAGITSDYNGRARSDPPDIGAIRRG